MQQQQQQQRDEQQSVDIQAKNTPVGRPSVSGSV